MPSPGDVRRIVLALFLTAIIGLVVLSQLHPGRFLGQFAQQQDTQQVTPLTNIGGGGNPPGGTAATGTNGATGSDLGGPSSGGSSSPGAFGGLGADTCSGTPPSDGIPKCGQCIPSGCSCSGGQWICTEDCKPVPGGCSSASSNSSNSSSSVVGGPPAPAPAAAAPAPAPGSSAASSASSASSRSSSSVIGGPPAPAPAPAGTSCPNGTNCAANICSNNSMPPMWMFSLGNVAAGPLCTNGACDPILGTFHVSLNSTSQMSCDLGTPLTQYVCPAAYGQNVHSWNLQVHEPRFDEDTGQMYTATLTAGGSFTYLHFGTWNCAAANTFDLKQDPGVPEACFLRDMQTTLMPEWPSCFASSSSSQASSLACGATGTCSDICTNNSMPAQWHFSIDRADGSNQCSTGECQPIVGTFDVALRKNWVDKCALEGFPNGDICTSQVPPGTYDDWLLYVHHPLQIQGKSYTATLMLGNGTEMYYHFGAWNCAGPNDFTTAKGLGGPDLPYCSYTSTMTLFPGPKNGQCSSTSGNSSSIIGGPPPPAGSSSSIIGGPPPAFSSSFSSTPKNNSCDDTACLFAGGICSAAGKTCRNDPNNPPQCYICVGSGQSSSSSTGLKNVSSSSTASSAKSSVASSAGSSLAALPPARCGNNITEKGETCDLGDAVNGKPGSPCSKTCLLGDGELCTKNQECDSKSCIDGRCAIRCSKDAQCPAAMYCNGSYCAALRCGDGRITSPETCDLGKNNATPTTPGAACACDPADPSCKKIPGLIYSIACIWPTCGDGVIDNLAILNGAAVNYQGIHESCDQGALNGTPGATCSKTCSILTAQALPSQLLPSAPLPSSLPAHAAPTADLTTTTTTTTTTTAPVSLPLMAPVQPQMPAPTTASVTPIAVSHAPVGKTGPEALLAIALGASAGWSVLRKRKQD